MFVFKKCNRQRATHVTKAEGKKAATLKQLRSFLDSQEPQTVRWLMSNWDKQQAAVTYKELREAILSGGMTEKQLQKWQRDYSMLVNTKLAPQWAVAMATAAEERQEQFPYFLYDPSVGASQNYIQQHGAELVTNLVNEQRDAIQAMVAQAAYYDGMTPDSLSRIIRPVIGLTTPQAKANLNYYNSVQEGLLKAHPRMTVESAEKKARDAAARYAARQHRYRAMNIARTELATAYNQGGYGAMLDAQEKGYIGDCKKVWLTADDERVCPSCGGVDGESVNMNDMFSNGVLLPPAHPQCRCAVAYKEVAENLKSTSESSIIEVEYDPADGMKNPEQDSDIYNVVPVKPQDAPLPQADTPLPMSMLEDGEILQATDVFENLSLIPESSYGIAVKSDSYMVEGQNLTARLISVDNGFTSNKYYEISGKLTEESWKAIAKNVQMRGYASKIEFERGMGIDGYFSTQMQTTLNGKPITLDGYKLMTPDQAVLEMYGDYSGKQMYSFGGYFRVRVPVTGDAAADTKAIAAVLDKAGLSGITTNPTAADELLMKKSRLAWQHAPSRVSEYESLTGAAREKKIDEILKDVGITPKRVAGLELQEVFPGYSTYVDKAVVAQYKKAGLLNVWAGVDNADAVMAITQSHGFVATNYKVTSGMKIWGASPESDMGTGGADSVFTRLGIYCGNKYNDSYLGEKWRIIIDPKEMARTDWYSYTHDNYGNATKSELARRPTPLDFIRSMKQSYRSGNEIMFRRGISTDSFLGISCESESLRTELIGKYKAAGVKKINGKRIERFIYVSQDIGY